MDLHTPPALPPARRPRRWVRRLFLFAFGFSLLANLSFCAQQVGDPDMGLEEYPALTESLAYGNASADAKVMILRLSGVILREETGGLLGPGIDPVSQILMEIQAATVDEEVSAILLEVDSPGGGVTASDEIYNALLRFKASSPDRKIVVHMKDLAASGGYYVAMAGDLLVAQPTTILGSVGVLISALNLSELGDKIGMKDVTLTSGANKDLLAPFRPMREEHQAILQKVVDDLYNRFRGLVLSSRPISEEFATSNHLLDGRIFTAPEALTFGLIDRIGYDDLARQETLKLLGAEQAGFYSYAAGSGLAALLGVETPRILPNLKLPFSPQTRFMYLWRP
jgi:protease-4